MLPNLGGEGSKSQKAGSFIGRIFGRQGSSKDEGGESPRNSTNRAGTGSLNAPTASKQYVEPRQAGAALTTGMTKPAQSKQDMFSVKSRKVLFQGGDEKGDSSEGRSSVLDHHNVFKRSHTVPDIGTPLSSSPKPAASPKSSISTATALANLGGKGDSGSSMSSVLNSRVSIAAAMNMPTEELDSKSADELKRLYMALQQQTKQLKHEVEEKKKSLSGSGKGSRASVVIDFSEPKHQQRPSLIEKNVEQIRNAAGSASARSSRVSYAPNTVGGIDEEDSGFLEDEAESKSKAKVGADGKVAMTDYYAAKEQEEARKKQKEKEAAEAAAAAIKERSKSLNSSAAQPAAGAPKRKYKLLSVYPLLSPNMRREEWSLKDFKIDKKLHAGYASEVYRAQDVVSHEIMAVKVYNLNALGELNKVQLIREIRLHGGFTHRNIIELFVAFQEEHRVMLAQKYAEGGDLLRALHKAGGRLTEKSAVQMVIHPLLSCLVYLHSKGITHRDIKPENILFDGEGVLKLADFGLAINMTEENAVTRAGTLHYMAPEVVKNPLKDHPNDFKNEARYHYNSVVDSWAVGCLAYELIVGFPPFMADTQQQVVKNINTKEVAYPKKMSDEMISFCKAALERHPENRATTAELIKHPWIMLHMRRNSSRQLNFESQGGVSKVLTDFASGTALAKAQASHRAADHGPGKSKEGSKVAPF